MLIRKYLHQEQDISEYLFPSPKKKYLSTEAVRQKLIKLGKDLPNPRKITPHMFRHSFATQQMKRGIDIDDIKADMGHSCTQTTSIYAAIPDEEFRNKYHKIMG